MTKQTYEGTLYQWVIARYPFTVTAESPEEAATIAAKDDRSDGIEFGCFEVDWNSMGAVEDVVIDTGKESIQFGYTNNDAFNSERGELVVVDRYRYEL